jgi:hypothetical protein
VDTDELPAPDTRVGDLVQNPTEALLVRQVSCLVTELVKLLADTLVGWSSHLERDQRRRHSSHYALPTTNQSPERPIQG